MTLAQFPEFGFFVQNSRIGVKYYDSIGKIRIMWAELRFESSVHFMTENNKIMFYGPWSFRV